MKFAIRSYPSCLVMGSHSSRSSTETSPSIWRTSKPTGAAWWSFVTRCEDVVGSHGTPPNNSMQQTALRAAADADRSVRHIRHTPSGWGLMNYAEMILPEFDREMANTRK